MNLAGYRFNMCNSWQQTNKDVLIVMRKPCHAKFELRDCDKYIIGGKEIYFTNNNSIFYVFVVDRMLNSPSFACSCNINAAVDNKRLTIYSDYIEKSILLFGAYYWLYTYFIDFVAIPGIIKNDDNVIIIEYVDDGNKVILFDQDKQLLCHQVESNEIVSGLHINGFKKYGSNHPFEIVMENGSRPFWTEHGMAKWLQFVCRLERQMNW